MATLIRHASSYTILTASFILFFFTSPLCSTAQNSAPYIVKINSGKAELRQKNGNLVRYIGNSDVVFTDINCNQDHILITTSSGKVELRSLNNNLIRYMGNSDALDARWSENDVLIRTKSGKLELRSLNNNLLRYL